MKNTTINEVKSLTISGEMLAKAGLEDAITQDVFQDVIVLKKYEMTALEMINTIEGMEHILLDLYQTLIAVFPADDDECEICSFCEDFNDDIVEVPNWAKAVAGIDVNTKMCVCVEEDSERILLEPVSYAFDITDVSDEMIETLSDLGVCLGELNESIMQEEIVYVG